MGCKADNMTVGKKKTESNVQQSSKGKKKEQEKHILCFVIKSMCMKQQDPSNKQPTSSPSMAKLWVGPHAIKH
jgi:hypothetical protein